MEQRPGQELPHDLLAERAVIGSLLIDNKAFDQISDSSLEPEDFFNPQYGIIFQSIKELAVASKPFDMVSVCANLNDMGKLEVIGGQSSIVNLIEDTASSANIAHYSRLVKNKSVLREIVRNSMRITDQGLNFVGNIDEFIDEVESSFFKLANQTKVNKTISLKDALRENLKQLEKGDREAGEITGLSTGWPSVDKRLLGLQPGQMIIIAARPGMGKTSFALNLSVNACKMSNLPVVIYSYEMVSTELSGRILSSEASVDSRKIRTKDLHRYGLT
jgi:replicative DNA helicase